MTLSLSFAVKSSSTPSDIPLKECAKNRLKSRFDISRYSSFDEVMKVRHSCHLIEHSGENFYCDCKMGIKGHLCKHSVALMYKCDILEVDSEVRSKPIGQKRKRGRPKKLPACLAQSPEPAAPGSIPRAAYHLPSPDTSFNLSIPSDPLMSSSILSNNSSPPAEEVVPAPNSPLAASQVIINSTFVLSPATAVSVLEPDSNEKRKRKRLEDLVEMPPPAKRVSRKKTQDLLKSSISNPTVKVIVSNISKNIKDII